MQVQGPYTKDKRERMSKKLKVHKLLGISKDNMMNVKQRNNRYGKLEAVGVNAAASLATAPVRVVHHAATTAALRTDKRQDQMNKWAVLALSASATFMTTLDGSIVNIGLPSIAHTFNAGISGAT